MFQTPASIDSPSSARESAMYSTCHVVVVVFPEVPALPWLPSLSFFRPCSRGLESLGMSCSHRAVFR